jgi:hypothetical protein
VGEKLPDEREFRVFPAQGVHALDGVGFAEPDERRAHGFGPLAIAPDRRAHVRAAGDPVGARNGDRRGDVVAAMGEDAVDRIEGEIAQFRPFYAGVKLANDGAPGHVAH